MTTPADSDDPSRCPLCGGKNTCARAADATARDCWCADLTFPESLFEQLPRAERNRRCICRRCVEQALRLVGPAN